MKRSQMIQILADNLYDTCIDRTEEQCKNTAEFILGIIECNGMLPPKTQIQKYSEMTDDSGNIIFDGMISVPGNEWEPEELIVTNVENKTVTFKLK